MTKKHSAVQQVFIPGPARGARSKLGPDDTWEAREVQNKEEMRKQLEAKEIKKQQREAEELAAMSEEERDRWQQSKDQKARDMQQASQTFSPEQPKTLHAFNPNAPEFVSSKVPKANNLQTQGSDINSQPLNLSRKAAQSKSSMPDTDSTASEPASPKIAAKMPVLNSQRPGNTQQTAAARPSSTKSAAAAAEPTSPAAEASQSATPRSDTDTSLNDHSTSAQTSEPSWLTLDAVREAESTPCTRQEAELEEQHLLGSDFKTSRRVQEVCKELLELTTSLTQLIRSDDHVKEDQDELNKMYIDVAAIARRIRNAKESRDIYLHNQAAARRAGTSEAAEDKMAPATDKS